MLILAIDPGPTQSGWCKYDGMTVCDSGVTLNTRLLPRLDRYQYAHCVIEWIAHYGTGMPAGAEVFDTCRWIGRFEQEWGDGATFTLLMRKRVSVHLCGSAKAKDPNIRLALMDKWGGKNVAIGDVKCRKCKGKGWFGAGRSTCPECDGGKWLHPPGPLCDVHSHAWSALALAVTWHEQNERTNDD